MAMKPANLLKFKFTEEEQNILLQIYCDMRQDKYTEGIMTKADAGIVFKPSAFYDTFPLLEELSKALPFVGDKCSFISTNAKTNKFKPHSDESHGSYFTILVGDDTTETAWHKIKNQDAFVFTEDLYGCIGNPSSLEKYHTEILERSNTYLLDTHTFHSVENKTGNDRIVFTWWLKHIAYAPAFEYLSEHGFIA